MEDTLFNVNCALCGTFITSKSQEKTSPGSIICVARMMDDRQFDYGISGVFAFKTNLSLKKDDKICNDCLLKHKDDIQTALTIECSNCGEMHQPAVSGARIGWSCSGTVRDKDGKLRISCGWGSKYDMNIYNVSLPVVKAGDIICDKCIELFVTEGSIAYNNDESGFL